MGSLLEESLAQELTRWEEAGLRRRLIDDPAAPRRVDFASNDYLGLARDPQVVEAARAALSEFGAGGRASRLLGGGSPLHHEAESAAAAWMGAQGALLFPSGYQANMGLITALAGRGDAIFSDRLVHASLIDAARVSRARVIVHEHLDLEELERHLQKAAAFRRRFVLTEGVFSMDGDGAPLTELYELCFRYDAQLILDEAHSAGLVGPGGAGAWAALERDDDTHLAARVVTGGKALGVTGAFVVGSRVLRELLINRSRAFVFTTAPSPATAGALMVAIERCRGADDERQRTLDHARTLAEDLKLEPPAGAIVPFVIGGAQASQEVAQRLIGRGFDVRAVRPPSVPDGTARLRLVAHAFNTPSELEELTRTLRDEPVDSAVRISSSAKRPSQVLFVVGTDTEVGKTVVSALLFRAAKRRGDVSYWKPVQTGQDSDTRTLGELTGAARHELLRPAWSLALPASPHAAAADEGKSIDPTRLEEALVGLVRMLPDTPLIVELAGGLLVPYRTEPTLATQADWLEHAGLPTVLVARSSLGTLNHTLLTLEALRARHVEPRALFLVGDPHPSNRGTLQEIAGVERVFEVPRFDALDRTALDAWLDANDLAGLFEARRAKT